MSRPVACPTLSEHFSPATRVFLNADVNEGDLIAIHKQADQNHVSFMSGLVTKRKRHDALTHHQSSQYFSKSCMLALCIDTSPRSSLISCQRYGAANFILRPKTTKSYGNNLCKKDIHLDWTKHLLGVPDDMKIGEVIAVYPNNPTTGFTTVRVRLTL